MGHMVIEEMCGGQVMIQNGSHGYRRNAWGTWYDSEGVEYHFLTKLAINIKSLRD